MTLTETLDLRGGRTCWRADDSNPLVSDPLPGAPVDVAIVGAGVMGAMLADRLSAAGRSVALLDRRPPAHGATAASTALVMWASDVPLSELAGSIGMEAAARRWRRVHQAVIDLDRRIRVLDLPCGWAPRPELYLAGSRLDEVGLRKEGQARQAAGLPSAFLEAGEVAGRFDIAARAALLSDAAFEVDPVALTLSLLAMARRRGASLTFPINVSDVEPQALGARLRFDGGGELTAGQVVLATGYEAARADLPEAFTLGSSFAIATAPGVAPRWAQKAMIWEASDPYLYARQTADGRVIVGGEDEDLVDAVARDAMIADKATILKRKAERMLDSRPLEIDCAWAATFGSSPDGLPAIGRARSNRSLWLASGFGGNGVSFASLAADLICAELSGAPDPGATDFDPYRFEAG